MNTFILTFVTIQVHTLYTTRLCIIKEMESRDMISGIFIHFCRGSITIITEVDDITIRK